MSNEVPEAAIAMLERGIEEAEHKIRSLRAAINTICVEAGIPARYAEADLVIGGAKLSKIQDDTFYGKKQTPAMREFLEMRRAQGLGPAKPREFFEALRAGGYQFETKDEETAIVGLRALLRTQPQIFHRLPQGTYGLTAWYPDAKKSRDEAVAAKKRGGKKRSRKSRKPRAQAKTAEPPKSDPKVVNLAREAEKPAPVVEPAPVKKKAGIKATIAPAAAPDTPKSEKAA